MASIFATRFNLRKNLATVNSGKDQMLHNSERTFPTVSDMFLHFLNSVNQCRTTMHEADSLVCRSVNTPTNMASSSTLVIPAHSNAGVSSKSNAE